MRFRRLIVAPVAVLGVLVFAGAPAQATGVRNQIGSFGPTGPGKGGFDQPQSIAVEQSTGDIYVYNVINATEASVYKFNAEGDPLAFLSTGTNVIGPFTVTGEVNEGQIAIDNSTGPDKGDIYIATFFSKEVEIYSPAGAKLTSLKTDSFVCGVTVDANGNLYTSMPFASEKRISKYAPLSSPIEENDLVEGLEVEEEKFCDVAADSAGDIYAAGFKGTAGVVKYEASQFETVSPTGAAIDSNPEATTLAVDPESGEEVYIDERSDIAVYTSGGTRVEEFGTGLLGGSFGVAVSDASGHAGDVYASAGSSKSEVAIFGPPSASIEFPLKVEKEGTGTGTVECKEGAGGSYEACKPEYTENTELTVKETASGGSEFHEVSGTGSALTCTSNPCTFTIKADSGLTAVFNLKSLPKDTLGITTNTGTGTGTVECKEGAGSYATCASEYTENTELAVKETASGGSEFHEVSGTGSALTCTSNPCAFRIEADSTIMAVFNLETGGGGGSTGPTGPSGPTGSTGSTGPTGSPGAPGLNGEQGEKGVAGMNGTNGQNGIPGPAGLQGPMGPNGAQGPAGVQGPAGPAGQVELVTCKTVKKGKKSVQQCTTKLVSGTVKFTAAGASAQATLSRHGAVYAAGTARVAYGHMSLRLSPLRRLGPGRYTLTLIGGAGRHETIQREAFTLR